MRRKYHVLKYKCETCGEEFVKPNYQEHKFCSRRCANIRRWLTEEGFWSRVDKSGGEDSCWEYQGRRDRDGYCLISWRSGLIGAHRLAYLLFYGEDPKELLVRHSCDNPPCCNPRHLLTGTIKDNSMDMVERGRSLRGELNHKAKLTEQEVIDMRRAVANGESASSVVRRSRIGRSSAFAAIRGATWKHLPGAIKK